MKIFTKIEDLQQDYPKLCIALGMFDGVHIGHQAIIREACRLAAAAGGKCMVFTFSNHPLSVLAPAHKPLQISDDAAKREYMAQLGVDIMLDVPFTQEMARLSPEAFLQMLQDNFAPYYLVTGPNYTFGFKGSGTYRMLLQGAERYGFRAKVCAAVAYGDQMVSSTRIRQCLSEGKLDLANAMLGRPFAFAGVVCHGDHRGHKLGFPTANLAMTSEHIMLPNGVYAVQVSIGEKKFCGVANIGANPTFNGQERRLEVSIIAFKGNIYGQRISVGFCHHLRDERRFATAEQLVSQLHKDEDAVRTFFRL